MGRGVKETALCRFASLFKSVQDNLNPMSGIWSCSDFQKISRAKEMLTY